MPDHIAVGIDGSYASRAAVEWAVRRAQRENSSVVLFHVANNTSHSVAETDQLVATELRHARLIAPDVSITIEIRTGEAIKVLAEESGRFSLLAVGTHKTGFLRGRAFGSTSLRLAAMSNAPLAVIPISSGQSRRGVVVGVKDELSSRSVVHYGAREAIRTDSGLTLLHVQVAQETSPTIAALALVHDQYPSLNAHARDVSGVAGEVLVNAGAAAEILVIGARSTAAGTGVGAVGYDVLLNISGPAILVPIEVGTSDARSAENQRRELQT